MLHDTSFQIINMYYIGGQNRVSELLWHLLPEGWCESDVILKNSKDLLEYIQSKTLSSCL